VGFLAQARTNREIAELLAISERTVKSYMSALMTKLKARNRVEIAIAARQHEEQERFGLSEKIPLHIGKS
jgi:DNA-binding NarL/FixJ family response regulator